MPKNIAATIKSLQKVCFSHFAEKMPKTEFHDKIQPEKWHGSFSVQSKSVRKSQISDLAE